MSKFEGAYKTIGEVVKIIGLKSKRGDASPTHTIRYWEKEFKQIKPKILNGNRRYYDKNNIDLIKKVNFLLKDQGMTIKGVKKILDNDDTLKLDENLNKSIKAYDIRNKLVKISDIIKNIKFLLKDKGMTIQGVKKQLDNDETNLDETANISINTKNILKTKLNKISKLIKEIKK